MSAAFRESQATIDAAQKRRMQSETLEALFEIFFRVLKQCTASGYAAAERKGASRPNEVLCRCHNGHLRQRSMSSSHYQHILWTSSAEGSSTLQRGRHMSCSLKMLLLMRLELYCGWRCWLAHNTGRGLSQPQLKPRACKCKALSAFAVMQERL